MSYPEVDELKVKVIMIGDSGVGKSCLLKSFLNEPWDGTHTTTIGVDFEIKKVVVDGRPINLQIWDTAGQERFRTITTSYYKASDAILLIFDTTVLSSFKNLDSWMLDVRAFAHPDVCMLLLGNKVDLESSRQVDFNVAKAWAEKNGMQYMETSAKAMVNVEKANMKIASMAVQKKTAAKPSTPGGKSVSLKNKNGGEEKKGCC